jgi:hypothetical protein
MGWNGINTNKSFDEVFRDEFATLLYNGSIRRYIEVHVDPPYDTGTDDESEFFLAVYRQDYMGCDVILFKRCDGNVLYKIMSDTEGPYTINKCPKEILELLSPTDKYGFVGYADTWRKDQY